MTEEYSNGRPVYPRRSADDSKLAEIRRKSISNAIDHLIRLEVATRPTGGNSTADGKDQRAIEALRSAAILVELLAGWAIDHQVGLAINGLQSVPRAPKAFREDPEYQEAMKAVDSHEHEREGSRLCGEDRELPPETVRLALINLLRGNSGGFPRHLQRLAHLGFEALNYSEVLPLMKPADSNRKVKYQEFRLQLEALSLIEYRVAHGMKKYEAQDEVAGALGVDRETLRTWDRRVRAGLGALRVRAALFDARDAALEERNNEFEYPEGAELYGVRTYGRAGLERTRKRWRLFKRLPQN